MAWNKPGNGNSDNPTPPPRSSGGGGRNPLDGLLQQLRGLFDGGNPLRWALVALALWLVFSSFVLVAEQQRGVVLRFGQFNRLMQPGPNFKLPWPFEQVTKVNATKIQTFDVTVPVLTSDENIVNVQINVQYRVGDPRQYLFGTRNADDVLKQAALSTVREQVGRAPLDTVLGARAALGVAAREQLQKSLNAYRTGLTVTELNLQNARPPDEVKPAFDDVNSAQQDKDRVISIARSYAAQVVPEARGQAASIRTAGEGYKAAKVARATGDAARFSLLVNEYKSAPEVTRKRLWLETVQEVLAENRKVVGGDGRQLIYVPMPGQGDASAAAAPASAPVVVPAEPAVPAASAHSPRPERTPRGN
ncbi:FtsH protease activity modulator HflK [Lysobacter pythonis]|uniref:Protein HflK n=1 Tax=Solilutibacter pythonis TaxID=2483112 RepID=A0A3M2HKF0_9GAMM|nr:FtsH protease activity modulator HflK [Lysobacter pythonis]RMH88353.1 FtsH protease activity modulator HflK [Lysobacter pythonis]